MKHCLLCDHQEQGSKKPDPDVEFICTPCIQVLVKTPQAALVAMYNRAISDQRFGVAYALHTFVPKKFRKQFRYKRNTGYKK